jgi:hypothetical protein
MIAAEDRPGRFLRRMAGETEEESTPLDGIFR